MIDEFWEMLESLEEEPDEWGEPYFSQQRFYDPVPIDEDNFNGFDIRDDTRTISCVDGGNNKIYETPCQSIHLIRVYFNLFDRGERVKNIDPFSAFLNSRYREDKIVAELHPVNDTIPFDRDEFVFERDELEDGKPVEAAHSVRKYLEWETVSHVAAEHLREGDIIVRDGVLQTGVEEERKYAEKAYDSVINNDVRLVGLAKTCSLRTSKGYPLLPAIRNISEGIDRERWYYHPVADNSNPDHMGEISFVKYHPSSAYAFRTEFFREQEHDIDEILGNIAYQAQDPIFLGYPYGLVDADKKARVTDEEIEYLKNMGSNKMGTLAEHKVNSMNAHDLLSNI